MKNYLNLSLLTISVSVLAVMSFQRSGHEEITKFYHTIHKNANGAPSGRTGAPGEPSCATSTCHGGMAQDGSTENVLTVMDGVTAVTSYLPGNTYTVTLHLASNPLKRGFQITALDASNSMAGTFTGQVPGGTTVSILAGRQYANHTDGSNEPSELSEWAWTWTAPAVDVGPVTFYLATNKSNADGLKTGDVIYLSQHVLNSSAGLDEENTEQYKFHVAYNANENKLNLNLLSLTNGTMFLNLVDSKGSSAITMDLGNAVIGENKTSVRIPSDLKSGIYYVNLFIGNYPVSAKVVINQ